VLRRSSWIDSIAKTGVTTPVITTNSVETRIVKTWRPVFICEFDRVEKKYSIVAIKNMAEISKTIENWISLYFGRLAYKHRSFMIMASMSMVL
tara:strand:+ start:159 stop:437 length:279 start_codon:yes stop_codon:yes gene_type:complete